MYHCEEIPYKVQLSIVTSGKLQQQVCTFWLTLGRMPTETFENMTLAFREKMLEVSIITGPKKARHTYPEW